MDSVATILTLVSVPIVCSVMTMTHKMIHSMNQRESHETCDIYQLIERVEELEQQVKHLKQLKQNELQVSYINLIDKLNE